MINLDKNKIFIEHAKRFNLVQIDHFIEQNLFNELRKKYPSDNYYEVNTKYAQVLNNQNLNFKSFLYKEKIWLDLINEFNSDSFKKKIIDIFKVKKVYFSDSDLRRFLPFYKKVCLEFAFNKSKNGSYNDPHTDSTRKIVSMIIFFTSDEWSKEKGGIVKLFTPTKQKDEDNWRNQLVNENDLKELQEIFPKPNRFYGFKKTKNSYHSVTKINCKDNESRNVLMINLSYANKIDIPYFNETIFKKILNKFWRRKI